MAILNNSPSLNLAEIIDQLFDNKLLADIHFVCGDQVIYAHSFLMMSRSIVYETEFNVNQGVQKLIPIQKYDYATFCEFIRFIYKDVCTITNKNVTELLELSVKFKIPKLENMVISYIIGKELTYNEKFKIYEFCETEKYQLLRGWISNWIGPLVPDIINSDHFTTIQPDLMESILKMNFVGTAAKPLKEVDLFMALIKWMNHYCIKHGIDLSERRVKFDGLIRSIRFPIMVFAELSDCIKKSDNLFTDSDCLTFFKSEPGELWNCTARQVCEPTKNLNPAQKMYNRYQQGYYYDPVNPAQQQFETTEKLIITGLKFISSDITSFQLNKTGSPTPLLSMQVVRNSSSEVIVSLGESIMLQPGQPYQISIPTKSKIFEVTPDLVHKDFTKYYKELERDPRLIEIIFIMP